jgi:hypothetical protein
LCLQKKGHDPQFSREMEPPWANSNLPFFRARAPGEGPLLVAELFAFPEGFRDGRAVDLINGPVRPPGQGADASEDHLLARARLPGDQDRGVHPGHPVDHLHHPAHALALAHDGRQPLGRGQGGAQGGQFRPAAPGAPGARRMTISVPRG